MTAHDDTEPFPSFAVRLTLRVVVQIGARARFAHGCHTHSNLIGASVMLRAVIVVPAPPLLRLKGRSCA